MKFLFMEPFFGGSHRAFALGWQAHSRHDIELLTLPDQFWKWRMRGAALQFLGQMKNYGAYDGIITSDMMNLADFIALARAPLPPCLVYFHENQLSYPAFPGKQPDESLALINITTALAARRIVFNSRFHQQEFHANVSDFFKGMPDGDTTWCEEGLAKKSTVCYPGCDFPAGPIDLAPIDPEGPFLTPPLIIWNHRWAYDKNPGPFFKALKILKMRNIPFRLALLGEAGPVIPRAFHGAREFFKDEIVAFGYADSGKSYENWLRQGAIVVSTALQENFGISVVEAVRNGCFPLLPRRLAYPEIIPAHFHDEVLYQDYNDLFRMLENILLSPHGFSRERRALAREMGRYAWSSVIENYDRELDLLARSPPGP